MEMSVVELGEKRGALGKPVWTGYTVQLLGPKTGQVGNKPERKGRLGWGGSPKCSKDTVFGELSPWGLGGGAPENLHTEEWHHGSWAGEISLSSNLVLTNEEMGLHSACMVEQA